MGLVKGKSMAATFTVISRVSRIFLNPDHPRNPLLPVHDMERSFLDRQCRLFYCFAQSWMRMSCAPKIFRAAAEFHHRRRLSYQFRCRVLQNMGAEDSIGFGVSDK